MINLNIDLGYVEDSRFYSFTFGYTGNLANGPMTNVADLLRDLCETIERYRVEFVPNKVGEDPSEFFHSLLQTDLDEFGGEATEFFEDAGWHLQGLPRESEQFSVWNVERWIDENSSFLEWFSPTGKSSHIREPRTKEKE